MNKDSTPRFIKGERRKKAGRGRGSSIKRGEEEAGWKMAVGGAAIVFDRTHTNNNFSRHKLDQPVPYHTVQYCTALTLDQLVPYHTVQYSSYSRPAGTIQYSSYSIDQLVPYTIQYTVQLIL